MSTSHLSGRSRLETCLAACRRLSDILDLVVAVPVTLTLIVLVAIVGYSVVARYVFASPPTWTEEVSLFLIIAVVFISLRVTFKRGQQIGITFFIDKFPRFRLFFSLFGYATTMLFMVVATIQSYKFANFFAVYKAPATGISFYWLYLGVTIGCGLTVLETILLFIQECCRSALDSQKEAQA